MFISIKKFKIILEFIVSNLINFLKSVEDGKNCYTLNQVTTVREIDFFNGNNVKIILFQFQTISMSLPSVLVFIQ